MNVRSWYQERVAGMTEPVRGVSLGVRILLLLPVLLTGTTAALADGRDQRHEGERDHMRARELVRKGAILPLEQVMERVPASFAGRLLEVELERCPAGYCYEIEIVDPQGVVRELKYDARTGELLHQELED